MSLEKLVLKYIASAEYVFRKIEIGETNRSLNVNSVKKILELAKAYLRDAKYYTTKKKNDVSLASVAYCEGLLDALRLIGAVKFEWPAKKEEKIEK